MTRLAAIAVLFVALPASAQFEPRPQLSPEVAVEEVDQATLSQLERAAKFFAEKQYGDGLETLRRAIDQHSQRLIPTVVKTSPKGFVTYLPLREYGQRQLCALPPEALRHYRSQVDGEAKSLLDEAQKSHRESMLQGIVDQYLASTWGDEAAHSLGDAAIARGDAVAARAAWLKLHASLRTSDDAAQRLGVYPGLPWFYAFRGRATNAAEDDLRQLLSAPAGASLLPACFDSNLSLADSRARLVLASILEGNIRRADWELSLFRSLHSGEQSRVAGKNVSYSDTLTQLLEQSRAWPAIPPLQDWPTFAGDYQRNALSMGEVDAIAVKWSAELTPIKSDRDLIGSGRVRVAEDHDSVLSYHPIVYQGQVIVGDGFSLRAFELGSGKMAWEVQLRERPGPSILTNQHAGVPRFTLSAAGGLIAATLPTPLVPGRRAAAIRREELSRLVAIDVVTRKLVFEVVADDATMIFEGTPVIDQGRAYVILRKQAEILPQLFVACFDLASGRRLWQQQLCAAQSLGEGKRAEYANSLLTLSHETLYCNTNLGVVAAVSTRDGAIRWLTKYPRASFPATKPERTDRHFFRDLNPCLLYQNQVFCAPADCERIFSLDATSGQLIWTLPPNDAADVVHLLGVKNDHLLASGDYLYWIDVVTGQIATQFPPAVPIGPGLALPEPRGWGRGVLVANHVYWPTRTAIHVFSQTPIKMGVFSGPQKVNEFDLQATGTLGGNLVIANGHLIVTTANKMFVYGASPAR